MLEWGSSSTSCWADIEEEERQFEEPEPVLLLSSTVAGRVSDGKIECDQASLGEPAAGAPSLVHADVDNTGFTVVVAKRKSYEGRNGEFGVERAGFQKKTYNPGQSGGGRGRRPQNFPRKYPHSKTTPHNQQASRPKFIPAAKVDQVRTIDQVWDIPLDIRFYSSTFSDIGAMSLRSKEMLDELKDNIAKISPWPDVWRRAVEANWVLGRINQACEAKPFSRAFFKLVEIIRHSSLIDQSRNGLRSVHLGEAPGGFFQAFTHCRGHPVFSEEATATYQNMLNDSASAAADKNCRGDRSWIVSLPSDVWPAEISPPSNFRHIVNFDIFEDVSARKSFCAELGNTVDFVTADGGFEVQAEKRREQEEIMFSLLFAETELALGLLRNGGVFVIKFFAVDMEKTRRLILQIVESFRIVHIQIPVASKPTNDERYIVARGFHRHAEFPADLPAEWKNWFEVYCIEDKLRQYEPISAALELCRTITTDSRLPIEPALGNAKAYVSGLGLPVKNIIRGGEPQLR